MQALGVRQHSNNRDNIDLWRSEEHRTRGGVALRTVEDFMIALQFSRTIRWFRSKRFLIQLRGSLATSILFVPLVATEAFTVHLQLGSVGQPHALRHTCPSPPTSYAQPLSALARQNLLLLLLLIRLSNINLHNQNPTDSKSVIRSLHLCFRMIKSSRYLPRVFTLVQVCATPVKLPVTHCRRRGVPYQPITVRAFAST